MADFPQAPSYRPDPAILKLGDGFYDAVVAADFPQTILRFRNDRAAARIGLDTLDDAQWVAHFGRFAPLPGNLREPLAMRYHGHQFRNYNPEIGDGRGFTFAQMRGADDALYELGTKGSGQTPYSRFGDGRLTLKGGVREILATEMLEALGVNTSRTFSLIETGEALQRNDEPSPTRAAVMVRMSLGHIRIGTFQRLAYFGEAEAMRRLVDYCLVEMFGVEPGDDPVADFLERVVAGTARMAAQFMVAGFVHGVLNTDNINVMGESFDYGPWRFAPTFDPGFTAAYFDHAGLYAYGRQPDAILWNVAQLAVSLRVISATVPAAGGRAARHGHGLAPQGNDRGGADRDAVADRPLFLRCLWRRAARQLWRGMGRRAHGARRTCPGAGRARPRLFRGRCPLFDADRRSGGDLVRHRRARRLGTAAHESRGDSRDG
jgi:uncharacterized protein YdiU (UPF0061 family)